MCAGWPIKFRMNFGRTDGRDATLTAARPQRKKTRSQADARIADRTASQHLWGHVTSSATWPSDIPYAISYWWSFGTKPLSITVSEIFNVECDAVVDMTLIRPLNKGQGHSFWYQSIYRRQYHCIAYDKSSTTVTCARTHRLATIHNVTDRQTTTDVTL